MKKTKVYYYRTLQDEVEHDNIVPPKIDTNYKYISKNIFAKIWEWFYYRIIIFPIGWFWCRCIKHIKYVGAKKIRKCQTGYFVYGNHTNNLSDAFSPSMLSPSKKPYLIVNPNNLNVPVLGSSTKFLGAMPLPDGLEAHKNFLSAVEQRIKNKKGIVIYPEAKIWPCYTGIRPFDERSFRYPAKLDVPAFAITTTYQKNKKGKCKMVVYVDGPFCADANLSVKEKQIYLHNEVFNAMQQRSKSSNFETNKFIKLEGEEND